MEVAACECPPERFGGALIAALEGHHLPPQIGQVRKVGRGQQLALNNREVDLDLVEPAGVNRRMDQYDIRPSGAKPPGSAPTAVTGAVIGDQEYAASRSIGLLGHDLAYEAVECCDAGLALAAPEQLGAMHVPRGKTGQSTGADVFVFHVDRAPRCRR